MANTTGSKTDPAMIARLRSDNESILLQAISDLHETGSPLYLPLLAEILLDTEFEQVKKSIHKLLGELKDKEAAPALISLIGDKMYLKIRRELLASCWQNGLDYSPWLPQLVDWVIESELEVAFEAFTIIENLDQFPPADIREAEVVKINKALKEAGQTKSYLLKELRGIIA